MRLVLLLIGIVALAGCDHPLLRVPPPSIGKLLTGEEINATLSGNSLVTVEERVPPLAIFFDANGEMHGLRSNNYRDGGTWAVENDAICGKWRNWYGTLSSCWEVFRSDTHITLKSIADRHTLPTILTAGNAVAR